MHKSRILVADDDAGMREFLQAALQDNNETREVLTADDGRKVIRMVEDMPVDLVITDLCMPEQDGLETIRSLRRMGGNIKIIAISGAFEGRLLKAAQLFGADAILSKPFSANELRICAEGLLAGAAG